MGRAYRDSDLKVLWGADAMCAYPGCRLRLIVPATDADPERVIGKISHIVAHSDHGPRADLTVPASERDQPDNLILLCGTHHDMVDVQPNTYTSDDLRMWKADHHTWVQETLADAVVGLTFDELRQVTAFLENVPPASVGELRVPAPPLEKMQYNALTIETASYYQLGQLRFRDVEQYIGSTTSLDPDFGERLKAGFQMQYAELRGRGLQSDDLYVELAEWAAGGRSAPLPRRAAGVAVLSYLFHICDVFESPRSE